MYQFFTQHREALVEVSIFYFVGAIILSHLMGGLFIFFMVAYSHLMAINFSVALTLLRAMFIKVNIFSFTSIYKSHL